MRGTAGGIAASGAMDSEILEKGRLLFVECVNQKLFLLRKRTGRIRLRTC